MADGVVDDSAPVGESNERNYEFDLGFEGSSPPAGIVDAISGKFHGELSAGDPDQWAIATCRTIYIISHPGSDRVEFYQSPSRSIVAIQALRAPPGGKSKRDYLVAILDDGSLDVLLGWGNAIRVPAWQEEVRSTEHPPWGNKNSTFRRGELAIPTASVTTPWDGLGATSYLFFSFAYESIMLSAFSWSRGAPRLHLGMFEPRHLFSRLRTLESETGDYKQRPYPHFADITILTDDKLPSYRVAFAVAYTHPLTWEAKSKETEAKSKERFLPVGRTGMAKFIMDLPQSELDFEDSQVLHDLFDFEDTTTKTISAEALSWRRLFVSFPANDQLPAGCFFVAPDAIHSVYHMSTEFPGPEVEGRFCCGSALSATAALLGYEGGHLWVAERDSNGLICHPVAPNAEHPHFFTAISAISEGANSWRVLLATDSGDSKFVLLTKQGDVWKSTPFSSEEDTEDPDVLPRQCLGPVHRATLIHQDSRPYLVLAGGKAPYGKIHVGYVGIALVPDVHIIKLPYRANLIPLATAEEERAHKWLVMSCTETAQTQLLDISSNTLEQAHIPGFMENTETIAATSIPNYIVQVTPQSVRWVPVGKNEQKKHQGSAVWEAPERLSLAKQLPGSFQGAHLMAVVSANAVATLSKLSSLEGPKEEDWIQFPEQISAVHLSRDRAGDSVYTVVGLWLSNELFLIPEDSKTPSKIATLTGPIRSIITAQLDIDSDQQDLLVGTSDGIVHAFSTEPSNAATSFVKVWTLKLSDLPVTLEWVPCTEQKASAGCEIPHVFATTDESFIITFNPFGGVGGKMDVLRVWNTKSTAGTAVSLGLIDNCRAWVDDQCRLQLGHIDFNQHFRCHSKVLEGMVPKQMEYDDKSGCLLVVSDGPSQTSFLHLLSLSPNLKELVRVHLKQETATALCFANKARMSTKATEFTDRRLFFLSTLSHTSGSCLYVLEIVARHSSVQNGSYTLAFHVAERDKEGGFVSPCCSMASVDVCKAQFEAMQGLQPPKLLDVLSTAKQESPERSNHDDDTADFHASVIVRGTTCGGLSAHPVSVQEMPNGNSAETSKCNNNLGEGSWPCRLIPSPFPSCSDTQCLSNTRSPITRIIAKGEDVVAITLNAGLTMYRLTPVEMGGWYEPHLLRTSALSTEESVTAVAFSEGNNLVACYDNGEIALLHRAKDMETVAYKQYRERLLRSSRQNELAGRAIDDPQLAHESIPPGFQSMVPLAADRRRRLICELIPGNLELSICPLPSFGELQKCSSREEPPSTESFIAVTRQGEIGTVRKYRYRSTF